MVTITEPRTRTALDGVTIEEYWEMAEDTQFRCELVEGSVVMAPPPNLAHGRAEFRFMMIVGPLVAKKGGLLLPGVGVQLGDESVAIPDLCFLPASHPEIGARTAVLTVVPELVVEVLSPSNARHDRFIKFALYEKAGVSNYWLADPVARTMTAFELLDGKYREVPQPKKGLFRAPPFADLEITVADVFAS